MLVPISRRYSALATESVHNALWLAIKLWLMVDVGSPQGFVYPGSSTGKWDLNESLNDVLALHFPCDRPQIEPSMHRWPAVVDASRLDWVGGFEFVPGIKTNCKSWYRGKSKAQRKLGFELDGAAIDQRLSKDDREISKLKFWNERIVLILQAFDAAQPRKVTQWIYDRRNEERFYGFWLAVLAVFFGNSVRNDPMHHGNHPGPRDIPSAKVVDMMDLD
jgi:hypothetical protein